MFCHLFSLREDVDGAWDAGDAQRLPPLYIPHTGTRLCIHYIMKVCMSVKPWVVVRKGQCELPIGAPPSYPPPMPNLGGDSGSLLTNPMGLRSALCGILLYFCAICLYCAAAYRAPPLPGGRLAPCTHFGSWDILTLPMAMHCTLVFLLS